MTIKDFMKGNATLEIICPRKHMTVRKLKVTGNDIMIDAIVETLTVPLDTKLTYQPWAFDRGDILFTAPGFGLAKLCTEWDIVKYGDGTEGRADHPDSTLFGVKA